MNNSNGCRICGKLFGSSDQERAQHRKLHSELAGGLLPAKICGFLELISSSVFRGGLDVNSFCEDNAKVAYVFSLWHSALRKGISKRKFNEFFNDQLVWVDSHFSQDISAKNSAKELKEKWKLYVD